MCPPVPAVNTRDVDSKSDTRHRASNNKVRWAPATVLGVVASALLIVPALAMHRPGPAVSSGSDTRPRSPSPVEIAEPAVAACRHPRSLAGVVRAELEPSCKEADQGSGRRRQPSSCEPTVRYGHVPGHLNPVLEIECSANPANKPTETDSDGSRRSTQPRIPQPTNSTNNSGVAVGYAPPAGAVAITAAQVSALAANDHAEPSLRRP
jgi:hypothetical protein